MLGRGFYEQFKLIKLLFRTVACMRQIDNPFSTESHWPKGNIFIDNPQIKMQCYLFPFKKDSKYIIQCFLDFKHFLIKISSVHIISENGIINFHHSVSTKIILPIFQLLSKLRNT